MIKTIMTYRSLGGNLAKKWKKLQPFYTRLKSRKTIIGVLVILGLVFVYLNKGLFVAATVNGQPIYRLSVLSDLERQAGQRSLDGLIAKTLISQESKKKGILVTDSNLESEIAKIEEEIKKDGGTLEQVLSFRGQTREDFSNQVRLQIVAERILEDKLSVTDSEIKDYFDKNKTLFEGKKFEDMREQISKELKQQKLGDAFGSWFEETKKNSTINYFVNY